MGKSLENIWIPWQIPWKKVGLEPWTGGNSATRLVIENPESWCHHGKKIPANNLWKPPFVKKSAEYIYTLLKWNQYMFGNRYWNKYMFGNRHFYVDSIEMKPHFSSICSRLPKHPPKPLLWHKLKYGFFTNRKVCNKNILIYLGNGELEETSCESTKIPTKNGTKNHFWNAKCAYLAWNHPFWWLILLWPIPRLKKWWVLADVTDRNGYKSLQSIKQVRRCNWQELEVQQPSAGYDLTKKMTQRFSSAKMCIQGIITECLHQKMSPYTIPAQLTE